MKKKQLPLINICPEPLEIWSEKLDTPLKLAEYALKNIGDNRIDSFIDEVLEKSNEYKEMKNSMPSKTPEILEEYQKRYSDFDNKKFSKIDNEIKKINAYLSEGQYLFHGGKWFDNTKKELITTRPFSTTFSPHIAVSEALFKGKAYDNGVLDLFVIKVKNPKTPVFVYDNKDPDLGREKEVLFASGAKLTLKSIHVIGDNKVYKSTNGFQTKSKKVPIRVLEVEIE